MICDSLLIGFESLLGDLLLSFLELVELVDLYIVFFEEFLAFSGDVEDEFVVFHAVGKVRDKELLDILFVEKVFCGLFEVCKCGAQNED